MKMGAKIDSECGKSVLLDMATTDKSTEKSLGSKTLEKHRRFIFPLGQNLELVSSMKLRIASSATLQVLFAMTLCLVLSVLIFHFRMKNLEARNDSLQEQLANVNSALERLVNVVNGSRQNSSGSIVSTNDPFATEDYNSVDEDDNQLLRDLEEEEASLRDPMNVNVSMSNVRSKRAAEIGSGYEIGSGSSPLVSKDNSNLKSSRRDKGKGETAEISKDKWRLILQKLKLHIRNVRKRAALTKNFVNQRLQRNEARAAYLTINGPNVNIRKAKQLIGPWFIHENPGNIGFNDLWYGGLSLDANGTSVIFQERGLYTINSQIYYHMTYQNRDKPSPLGYRIYLRKNKTSPFLRPIPIAECVPSFPSTKYQTCATQVTWFIEAEDEIFLEHFTDSEPMIEAEQNGQTFLNIVRLSS